MSLKNYFVVSERDRRRIVAAVMCADVGDVVRIEEPAKSRDQEMKYHAMFGDIAKSCEFLGQKWGREDWKRLLVDAFVQEMRNLARQKGEPDPFEESGKVVPSLDGSRVVQLGVQTRNFRKAMASLFIEYLYWYGADSGVVWSESSKRFFDEENVGAARR